MNITLKNVPDDVYKQLKRVAEEEGRSLNTEIIHLLAEQATELDRRRRMRESRRQLDRFVTSLPTTGDSTKLIREDRER